MSLSLRRQRLRRRWTAVADLVLVIGNHTSQHGGRQRRKRRAARLLVGAARAVVADCTARIPVLLALVAARIPVLRLWLAGHIIIIVAA